MLSRAVIPVTLLAIFLVSISQAAPQRGPKDPNISYSSPPVTTVPICDDEGCRNVAYHITQKGLAIVGGDIIYGTKDDLFNAMENANLTHEERAKRGIGIRSNSIVPGTGRTWPGGVIYYKYGSAFLERSLSATVNASISQWLADVPCLKFVRLPPNAIQSSEVVTIVNNESGCSASIGYGPLLKVMDIGPECPVNRVIHEWGHILGLKHEQKRFDRETHVHFACENLSDYETYPFPRESCCQLDEQCCGLACQFTVDLTTYTGNAALGDGFEYDVDSIMHYPADAFAKPGLQTLIGARLEHGAVPSVGDVARVRALYGCS